MPERERGSRVPPQKEREPIQPYWKAAAFADEPTSAIVYTQAQETIFATPCDLSAYRLQLDDIYHVAIIGIQPKLELAQQLETLLAYGQPVELHPDVLAHLFERRMQESNKGPWVERHHRPGKPTKL